MRTNPQSCASIENFESLVELFERKGRYDAETGKVKEAWQLKIFRSPAKDQLHKDFIAQNRFYSDEENMSLIDLFNDNLAEMPAFLSLARQI